MLSQAARRRFAKTVSGKTKSTISLFKKHKLTLFFIVQELRERTVGRFQGSSSFRCDKPRKHFKDGNCVDRPPRRSLARSLRPLTTSSMPPLRMRRTPSRHGRKCPLAPVLDTCSSIRISSRFIR